MRTWVNSKSSGASFSTAFASLRLNESLRRLPTKTATLVLLMGDCSVRGKGPPDYPRESVGGASTTEGIVPSVASRIERRGRRDDVVFRRNHQERRAGQRRERVRADHAPERARAEASLDHRGDDALAHSRAAAALVDDEDALGTGGLLADPGVVERHQPAQVAHAHLPAVGLL